MDYNITASDSHTTYTLKGHKYLGDEPGFGAWAGTSILFSEIVKREGKSGKTTKGYGVLRVTLDEFMFQSLPSFTVTGSDDEARDTQTILRFMQFFVGGLENVYFPGIGRTTTIFRKRGAS